MLPVRRRREGPGATTPCARNITRVPAFVPTSTSGRCAAVLAVIGVIASLTFVVLTISEREGADTPVDVTRRLVQSIVDNDRVGALDALAPTERSLLADRGDDVLRELCLLYTSDAADE